MTNPRPQRRVANPFDDYLQVDDMLGLSPRTLDTYQAEAFEMLAELDRIHPPPPDKVRQRILERVALESFVQRIAIARNYTAPPTRKS